MLPTYMPKVITIADDLYEELKLLKGKRSFSQLFRELLRSKKGASKQQIIEYIKHLEVAVKGKREKLSERMDEVPYDTEF